MKVPVNLRKPKKSRERVKVEVTLAKGKASFGVNVPVRVVNHDYDVGQRQQCSSFEFAVVDDICFERVEHVAEDVVEQEAVCAQSLESAASVHISPYADTSDAFYQIFDNIDCDDTPDTMSDIDGISTEEELLALIAEEEARLAHIIDAEQTDCEKPDETEEESYVIDEEPNVTDEEPNVTDEEPDIALESDVGIIDVEAEDEAQMLECTDEVACEDEDSEQTNTKESTGVSVRFFDRSDSGQLMEVDRNHATGQEVVTYDENSGRLSRVCGIIKRERDNTVDVITSMQDDDQEE